MVRREMLWSLLLLVTYGLWHQQPAWNELSRVDLVLALVDDRTLRIDRYHENTGDKALFGGHYYSDKAPGVALLGAPVYGAMRAAAHWRGLGPPGVVAVLHALVFVAAALPTVGCGLLVYRFLRARVPEWWAMTVASGYALGTIAFPFATMLFGHAPAAAGLFGSFYLAWRARRAGWTWRLPLAGALAGWAVLAEYPAALGVVVLLAYATWRHRTRTLAFVAGGLPGAAVLGLYNWLAFGSPLTMGYRYHVSFSAVHGGTLFGVGLPRLATLGELLVGPRGLLRYSPWLGLAPVGLWHRWRMHRDAPAGAGASGDRAELLACGAIAGLFLAYNSGYAVPFGGWTPGPRFLMPALPFAAVLVGLVPAWTRLPAAALIGLSAVAFTVITATMPNAPERFDDPLVQLWLPRLLAHDLVLTTAWLRWGLAGIQPLVLLGVTAGVTLVGLALAGRENRLAHATTVGCLALLAMTVLAVGTPLDLSAPVRALTVPRAEALVVVDAGVTLARAEAGRPMVMPWAQVSAGRGVSMAEPVEVRFALYAVNGAQVHGETHRQPPWRPGERRHVRGEWPAVALAPGEYRLDVSVTSVGGREVYATMHAAGHITVGDGQRQASG